MGTLRVSFDTAGIDELVADLDAAGPRVHDKCERDVKKSSDTIRNRWKSGARASSGAHGVHFPGTITSTVTGLSAEIGPESGMPQGGMGRGFEWGSVNQPPHLDMTKTVDVEFPKFVDKIAHDADDFL